MGTYGPDYDEDLDGERVAKQHERIRDLMLDGSWRTLDDIAEHTGDPASSISAQLRHLRKTRFGGYAVEKRRRGDEKGGLWEYQVRPGEGQPVRVARRQGERGAMCPFTVRELRAVREDLRAMYGAAKGFEYGHYRESMAFARWLRDASEGGP